MKYFNAGIGSFISQGENKLKKKGNKRKD